MSHRSAVMVALASTVLALAPSSSQAHDMTATTSLSRFKVPGGPTFRGDKIVILGRLKSADATCNAGVTVGLYRLERAGERLLARDLTDAEGEYVFQRRPRHGQMLVVKFEGFTQSVTGHQHACGGSRSRDTSIKLTKGGSKR